MQLPMSHVTMGGEGSGEEEASEHQVGRGSGGAVRERPVKVIPCPRCQSMNTKFCYYNNYSVAQPRHFCRNCQRYWTVGGTLRNVPVGGGSRKKARARSRTDPYHHHSFDSATSSPDSLLHSTSACMQQLSMLPPTLGFSPFPPSQLPFLQLENQLFARKRLAGLQEVPELQSFCGTSMTPAQPPLLMPSMSFFTPSQSFPSHNEPLVSVMAKAGLWEVQPSALGYGLSQAPVVENSKVWESASRAVMDDRLVPHASWEESNPSTTHTTPNLSPNSTTTCYYDDVGSQPWVGLHAADILRF
jgi:hypothetical protein